MVAVQMRRAERAPGQGVLQQAVPEATHAAVSVTTLRGPMVYGLAVCGHMVCGLAVPQKLR